MDGVGVGRKYEGNAFYQAQTPNLDCWMSECQDRGLYTELKAHGPAVGLPTDQDMGNSEVGHNAIGAGQIIAQGAKRVNQSLNSGDFFETKEWNYIVKKTAKLNSTLHFIGLLSDGNVHSHIDQLFGMLDGSIKSGVTKIRIHPLLDGRDVPPLSALKYIHQLENKLSELEKDHSINAKIGSGGGRMYVTMDRYESNWQIVKRGWDAHVRGVVSEEDITDQYQGYFRSAREAIKTAREVYPKKKDQYNPPFVIIDSNGNPIGRMEAGDAVINFNFRGDRSIEISKAFDFEDFDAFDREYYPNVRYAGLLEYDTDKHIPEHNLIPPTNIQDISAEFLCNMEISSFAIAETHKFGHITYFYNGNRTGRICPDLEKYIEIKSEPNEMIESHPEMKADEVTAALLEAIKSDKYKYLRVNYANGDMVGHTGNIKSGIRACEKVDECVKRVVDLVMEKDGIVLITADHGNIEELLNKNGKEVTAHSLNPVPFIILDRQFDNEYMIDTSPIKEPGLTNILPTLMYLMGYKPPKMYCQSLIQFKN